MRPTGCGERGRVESASVSFIAAEIKDGLTDRRMQSLGWGCHVGGTAPGMPLLEKEPFITATGRQTSPSVCLQTNKALVI